jgi:transposase
MTPFRDQVIALRQRGVECRAIFDILREQHAFAGSYGSVYRYVRHLKPRTPDACVRVERDPGDEAQVDFGYAGLRDPASDTLRKAWAFVMTLSFSRHLRCLVARGLRRSASRCRDLQRPREKSFGNRLILRLRRVS